MEVMSFYDYWRILSPEGKQDFANKLHTTHSYLSQLAHGHRKPSRRMVDLACHVAGKTLEFPGCCED